MTGQQSIKPIVKPPWTKPLDTIELCLERLDTDAYAHDWKQHLSALSFLAYRRERLPYDIEVRVPQGDDWQSRTNDPAWKDIVSLTEDHCGCGQHRVIVGGAKTSELAADTGMAVAKPGNPIYLLPRGLRPNQTLIKIAVMDTETGPFLTFHNRPFTAVISFNELFSVKGYDLTKLADSITKSGAKPPMTQGKGSGKWTLFTVESIDPAEQTVTIRPNVVFSVIRD